MFYVFFFRCFSSVKLICSKFEAMRQTGGHCWVEAYNFLGPNEFTIAGLLNLYFSQNYFSNKWHAKSYLMGSEHGQWLRSAWMSVFLNVICVAMLGKWLVHDSSPEFGLEPQLLNPQEVSKHQVTGVVMGDSPDHLVVMDDYDWV